MARDWSREPYRKLFLRPSKEWQALPVLVRGLGDELLRLADDDGRIFVGDDDTKATSTLCRLLGAHPDERKLIARKLAFLLANDNFLVRDGAYLVVRSLADAHRRTAGKGPATAPRASQDQATGEPRASHGQAPAWTPAGHGQATGEPPASRARAVAEPQPGHGQATDGTAPSHAGDLTARNCSPDLAEPSRTRARSQAVKAGREGEGKEGREAPVEPAPPPPATNATTLEREAIFAAIRGIEPVCERSGGAETLATLLQVAIPSPGRHDAGELARLACAQVLGEIANGRAKPGGLANLVRSVFVRLWTNPADLAKARGESKFASGADAGSGTSSDFAANAVREAEELDARFARPRERAARGGDPSSLGSVLPRAASGGTR